MTAAVPQKILARQHEITAAFLKELDIHLADIYHGRTTEMFEIRDFARILHIHPTHLSNTIKIATGKTACSFFEEKILDIAKLMLAQNDLAINEVATRLTYDPSNFTKFFKHFTGLTPKQYRLSLHNETNAQNTVLVTI